MTQVHIVQKLAPGGIEQLVLSLAGDQDVQVFSLDGCSGELIAEWPRAGAIAARLTAFAKRPGLDAALPFRIARKLRESGATSVVTHHVGPLLYGGLGARLAGVPVLAHVEHDAWHLTNKRRRVIVRAALSLLKPKRIAVSRVVADAAACQTGLPFGLIANGVDCGLYKPMDKAEARRRIGLPLDKRIIGAAGRLEEVKGFDRLVRAAQSLPDDVLVVIWGDGSERSRLEALVSDLGLKKRVLLPGRSDRLETLYPALDLFCLPSRSEGLPLSILEAQAAGIPVVASDVGGVRDGLCSSTGLAVTIKDDLPQAFAAALLAHLDKPLGASPRGFVQSTLSLEKTRDAYRFLETTHA